MRNNLKRSIDRAIALLQTPTSYENYISIKLSPIDGGCCCFHCWPITWEQINQRFSSEQPMKDEGDLLIESGEADNRLVLECHETGPEIIIYLGMVTASLALLKTVLELIVFIIKARGKDVRSHQQNLNISIHSVKRDGSSENEESIQISMPATDLTVKAVEKFLSHKIIGKS